MAETPFPGVYLETMEGTSGKNPKSDDSGHSKILCAEMGICTALFYGVLQSFDKQRSW